MNKWNVLWYMCKYGRKWRNFLEGPMRNLDNVFNTMIYSLKHCTHAIQFVPLHFEQNIPNLTFQTKHQHEGTVLHLFKFNNYHGAGSLTSSYISSFIILIEISFTVELHIRRQNMPWSQIRAVPQNFGEPSFFVSNSQIWALNNFDVEKMIK